MEKIVFKNYIANLILGVILILLAVLSYTLGWLEEYLPYVIGGLLILLSLKRFIYTFKKIVSKHAALILIVEIILDFVFAGLLIYLKDHVELFVGLIIYIRGVSYLLINFFTTRKLHFKQYVFNIGYITLGSFFMFYSKDYYDYLVAGIAALVLIVGGLFLQAGLMTLKRKEKQKEEVKEQLKQEEKKQKIIHETEEKIEELEEKLEEVKKEVIPTKVTTPTTPPVIEKKETKEVEEPEKPKENKPPKIDYESKTVAELKQLAKDRELSGYSSLNKKDLIELLKK